MMNNYPLIIVLSMFFIQQTFSQHKGKYQYLWAIFHPIAAIKVNHIYKKNYPLYLQIKTNAILDTLENGGKLDAFRHTFFMACFAQKVKPKKLIKLGIAHEKDDCVRKKYLSSYDSLNSKMDLHNNIIGIELGKKYKKIPTHQLKDTIVNYILNNKLIIIYLK